MYVGGGGGGGGELLLRVMSRLSRARVWRGLTVTRMEARQHWVNEDRCASVT